jgi:hypothetical protein
MREKICGDSRKLENNALKACASGIEAFSNAWKKVENRGKLLI